MREIAWRARRRLQWHHSPWRWHKSSRICTPRLVSPQPWLGLKASSALKIPFFSLWVSSWSPCPPPRHKSSPLAVIPSPLPCPSITAAPPLRSEGRHLAHTPLCKLSLWFLHAHVQGPGLSFPGSSCTGNANDIHCSLGTILCFGKSCHPLLLTSGTALISKHDFKSEFRPGGWGGDTMTHPFTSSSSLHWVSASVLLHAPPPSLVSTCFKLLLISYQT